MNMAEHAKTSFELYNFKKLAAAAAVGILAMAASTAAFAGDPAAVVEDAGDNAPVELFEFLEPGRTITLANGSTVTIGYLKSCLRETITGGNVVIGTEKSAVTGGKVSAETVECDGGKMNIPPELAAKSATTVFRDAPTKRKDAPPPRPHLTVFSLTPLISVPKTETAIELRRLDASAPKLDVAAADGVADLAKQNTSLEPGGIYAVKAGKSQIIVKIDPLSGRGGPVVSRLIRFAQ
jgi:hypothetical protein